LIPASGEKIFHLAIPPEGVTEVLELIARNFGNSGVKILLEKPFGNDLATALDLVNHADKYFSEEQIYRVDHYLAKRSAQNVTRKDWPRDNIKKIEILASEQIGIEGRVNFYEKTGALRDVVQSHLLELLALALAPEEQGMTPEVRVQVLQSLEVICDITKRECVKRGQYEGYREEVGNPESLTETLVEVNIVSNDPRWRGVEIKLATGKALSEKFARIKIIYREGAEKILNIDRELDAYEKVILAALKGERSLFMSKDEVLESWRILDAIQATWKNRTDDLIIYKKGSNLEEI